MRSVRTVLLWSLASLWLSAFGTPGYSAVTESVETWSLGTAGWDRYDVENQSGVGLANGGGYLQVVFDLQDMSMPEMHLVRALTNSSGGYFTGDYDLACVTNVSFRFWSDGKVPGALRLYVRSGSGGWWSYGLGVTNVGSWVDCSVPMDYWSGWKGDGGGSGKFRNDLNDVKWIGFLIRRNDSVDKQVYGVSDFVLHGTSRKVDSDRDGMNDWAEFLAGTDAQNANSSLRVEAGLSDGWVVLKWESVLNRVYGIWRGTNLLDRVISPDKIASGIPATPPVNVYTDSGATGSGPYYYRIKLEE